MKSLKFSGIACLTFLSVFFNACNEDDEYFDEKYQSTPISITQIYLEDHESSVPDRAVDFARLGQLIRIEGSGFMGMKKIYINGYESYFNRTFVSDNSLIVQINSKTPIVDADPEERDVIRLVKDKTESSYAFTIRAAAPSISHISNTLPQTGEIVKVYGTGLQETSKVTLPGGIEITTGLQSDEDGEWYSFVMPSGVTQGGSIYSEGANGQAATPGYFNFTDAMIMNFDGIGVQGSWGDSNKDGDGNIKPGVSMIYPEDLVEDPAGTGRGKCVQIVPERLLLEGGISSGKPRASECWTAGNDDAADDWSRMTTAIPASTPATELALQFDIYVPTAWSGTGYLQICLINNFNYGGIGSDDDGAGNAVAFYVPWIQANKVVPFTTEGWQTVTIPFSSTLATEDTKPSAGNIFGKFYGATFQDIIDTRNSASYRNFGIGFVNTDFTYQGVEVISTAFSNTRIYLDNWRIVPCKNITISDYPEEETE